jgi:hypothetical protein
MHANKWQTKEHPLQSKFGAGEMSNFALTSGSLTAPALEAGGWLHEA